MTILGLKATDHDDTRIATPSTWVPWPVALPMEM
jgi:hypothetical protein